jgi:aminopeptidase
MEDRVERLAWLIVEYGANVQPGQLVDLGTDIGKEEVTRAIAAAAYRRGAKFVDVVYYDPYVKRARIENVADESLEYIPPWWGERVITLGREHAASILLAGPPAPRLFDDLDPGRLGRDIYPRVKQWSKVTNERTVSWCIAPCPTRAWAEHVHPELSPEEALERLWEEIEYVLRLDEEDPVAAWTARNTVLEGAARRLTALRLDALHFEGAGTDLTVGLLPGSRWVGGAEATVDGIVHMANIPSEEVFTTPDPERVDGVVRSTKPLEAYGSLIEGLRIRFEGGRAVQIDADKGAEVMRSFTAIDDGASRLGEVALVDGDGRVGDLGTVFIETLLDENAASHVAFGDAYESGAAPDDHPRINRSELHLDFMIGGSDVDVTGITQAGERVPVLRSGAWQT